MTIFAPINLVPNSELPMAMPLIRQIHLKGFRGQSYSGQYLFDSCKQHIIKFILVHNIQVLTEDEELNYIAIG